MSNGNGLPIPASEAEAIMAIQLDQRLIASYESENQTDHPAYAQAIEHLRTVRALYPQVRTASPELVLSEAG